MAFGIGVWGLGFGFGFGVWVWAWVRVRFEVRVRVRVISAAITGARKAAAHVSDTGSEVHCCWKVAASNVKPGVRRRLG